MWFHFRPWAPCDVLLRMLAWVLLLLLLLLLHLVLVGTVGHQKIGLRSHRGVLLLMLLMLLRVWRAIWRWVTLWRHRWRVLRLLRPSIVHLRVLLQL
jgi:hypothetical protein